MPRSLSAAMLAALGVLLATACGPLQTAAFLTDAEGMLAQARQAQADRYAPYEWTAANLYYLKAKEEVGYSEFEQAVDFAHKAVDFATRARDGAQKAARRPAPGGP